ncbi:hypothetical protein EMIT0215P_130187 [Pseudomonas serboccidentalis]
MGFKVWTTNGNQSFDPRNKAYARTAE